MTAGIPTLRLFPVEFGYGPLGKALHIARAVRQLVGRDRLSLELVTGESFHAPVEDGLFDSIQTSLAHSPTAELTLTIMNSAGVTVCKRRGERVFILDSLAWLWDAPLPGGILCDRYYYQSIPTLPVPQRNLEGLRDARPVPAIAASIPMTSDSERQTTPRQDLLPLSLSGLTNPVSRTQPFMLTAYLEVVLGNCAERIRSGELESSMFALYGNPSALRKHLPSVLAPAIRSGKQVDFLSDARQNQALVAAPGLTTILECLVNRIPLALLPPQNYSQVKIFQAFTAAGITGQGWDSPLLEWVERAVLPEPLGVEIVSGVVASRWGGREYTKYEDLRDLATRATALPDPSALIGSTTNGAEVVAADLVSELC